jgi:putative endonuclease
MRDEALCCFIASIEGAVTSAPSVPSLSPSSKKALGDRAERAAAAWFLAQGFEILTSNLRVGRFEIDLLLRDGPVIVLVEVRTRGPGAWTGALASIDAKKRARLRAAGERLWRERFAQDRAIDRMRFDVAAVELLPDGNARVEHVKAAF